MLLHLVFPLKMLQIKVPHKFGIQACHVKPEKITANLTPSSFHYQKTRAKKKRKKMKKSGVNKLKELDTAHSQNLRMLAAGAAASTSSYMKSISSTNAREKPSKVTKCPQTSPDNSSLRRKGLNSSKLSSNSTSFKMMTALEMTRRGLEKIDSPSVCPDVERETCSSSLKRCKFPDYLKISSRGTESSEGTSAKKVCPYNYCSLNGHNRAHLPPLKCFLSAKRTQKSTKLGYHEKLLSQHDTNGSTISPLTRGQHNYLGDSAAELIASAEICSNIDPSENLDSESFDIDCERCQQSPTYLDDKFDEIHVDRVTETHSEQRLHSTEQECNIVQEVKNRTTVMPETEDSSLTRARVKCKKYIQELDELGNINPRAPDFLPLEPDAEAEKVDLRHQEHDQRKNTEEWMVDYAIRQAVTKLGPDRARKVALLIEAFEIVMPTTNC